ncbi:MAG: hypothetical protein JW384_04144 [Nitrosomonadaceae bacterium]|nr:hypothetical protein [Nitrosomonadaceae bacterium]
MYGSHLTGALGDLDGDGDLDLVAPWSDKDQSGWLLAFNDGKGGFTHTQVEHFPLAIDGSANFVAGADLDGNGRMDLVLYSGTEKPVQIWLNDVREGWKIQEVSGLRPWQVTDLDQDGDLDLWGWVGDPAAAFVSPPQFLFNDGKGHLGALVSVEPPAAGYFAAEVIYPTTQAKSMPLLWREYGVGRQGGQRITYQVTSGEVMQESLSALRNLDWFQTIQVGDFDLDGYTDLMTSDQAAPFNNDEISSPVGLNVLHNRGDGQMDTVSTFPDLKYTLKVQVADVNRDGIPDMVVAHKDLRAPAVVVLLGQGDGRFVEEGRYPLIQGRGGPTLSGDLDNDGDVDLVMFDNYVAGGGGGVHVLLNRLADGITAVEEMSPVVPTQHHLGTAYPNPFNPGVVIPFTLGPAADGVTLRVYNTLGQEVRTLELGVLPAGAHQVAWDGRDGQGKELSSGVYVYRLQAGAWSATGKIAKSQ